MRQWTLLETKEGEKYETPAKNRGWAFKYCIDPM